MRAVRNVNDVPLQIFAAIIRTAETENDFPFFYIAGKKKKAGMIPALRSVYADDAQRDAFFDFLAAYVFVLVVEDLEMNTFFMCGRFDRQ